MIGQETCVQNLHNLADQQSGDVLTECKARNIAFVPFCPLGWPGAERHRLLADPVLAQLAARLGATPAQIALAWLLDLAPNVLLIPGTRTRAHLAENLGAAAVRLDETARAELTRRLPLARTKSSRQFTLFGRSWSVVNVLDSSRGFVLGIDECGQDE
jgi:pyridoxine 4-dehydrogenase